MIGGGGAGRVAQRKVLVRLRAGALIVGREWRHRDGRVSDAKRKHLWLERGIRHGSGDGLVEGDGQDLCGTLGQDEREERGPAGHGGVATTPGIDLAGRDAGEAAEGGLAGVRLGQFGGESGAGERVHGI